MKEESRLIEADVSHVVSQMISDHLEVDVEQVRSGASFMELHSDFDSLAVLHIQNLVEERFGISLTPDDDGEFPMCLHELVKLVMRCSPGALPSASTLHGHSS